MNDHNSISVVIVSWNVRDLVDSCIESLLASTFDGDLQIIVIDNASSDGTAPHLLCKYQDKITLVANPMNIGFARANNQGFDLVKFENILILNPDTTVQDTTLKILMSALMRDPSIGMVGPRLILPDGSTQEACARRFQSISSLLCCDVFHLNRAAILGPVFNRVLMFPYDYNKAQYVEALSGAAMLIRRRLLVQIGGFHSGYYHGGEDMELCYNVNRLGFKNYYEPTAEVTHFDKGSSRQARVRIAINAQLSIYLFHLRTKGKTYANVFKFILRRIHNPLFIAFAFLKYSCGFVDKKEYHERAKIYQAINRWNPIH